MKCLHTRLIDVLAAAKYMGSQVDVPQLKKHVVKCCPTCFLDVSELQLIERDFLDIRIPFNEINCDV
jgi:hypothetical protein